LGEPFAEKERLLCQTPKMSTRTIDAPKRRTLERARRVLGREGSTVWAGVIGSVDPRGK